MPPLFVIVAMFVIVVININVIIIDSGRNNQSMPLVNHGRWLLS